MKQEKIVIYCKLIYKGQHSYFLSINNEEYYLFTQKYRKSNKEFFGSGALLDNALDFSLTHSTSVRKTMTKLIRKLKIIEKEYELIILRKTRKEMTVNKKDLLYNRQQFKTYFDDVA